MLPTRFLLLLCKKQIKLIKVTFAAFQALSKEFFVDFPNQEQLLKMQL